MTNSIDFATLRHTINSCPADQIPTLVFEATGVAVPSPETELGDQESTYKTHPVDWAYMSDRLEEIFAGCSKDQVKAEIIRVYNLTWKSEFGNPGYSRAIRPEDPYWFEGHLIANCRSLLAEDKPDRAFSQYLLEHNHGHSGFVDQTARVYFSPRNDDERRLSAVFRQLHIDTVVALLEKTEPCNGIFDFMDVELAWKGVERLGADVPDELIVGLKKLIKDSAELEDPIEHAADLLEETEKRFP